MRKICYKDIEKFIVVVFFIADFFQRCDLTSQYVFLEDSFKCFGALISISYWIILGSQRYKLKMLIWQIALGGGILYTSTVTHNFSFFIIYCMILTAKNISIREYMELIMKCQFIQISMAIVIWLLNVIFGLGMPFYYNALEHRVGFCFGHPNKVALTIIWCCVSYLLLSTRNNRKKRLCIVTIAGFLGAYATKSSTFVFLTLFVILYLCKNTKAIVKIINIVAKYIFPITGIFIYTMSIFYTQTKPINLVKMSKIIDMLSNFRVAMSSLAFRYNGITWFGQVVNLEHQWETAFRFGNYTIDILYVYIFVSIGIVYFIIISFGLYKIAKAGNYMVSLSIVMFALCGLAELSVLYITTCFVLMLLKVLIYGNEDLRTVILPIDEKEFERH